jgi:arylsulfatase
MAVYAAQIDRMDQNIGRILAKLREISAEENTLILFLSDNGGCAEVIHRGKPGATVGTRESFESYGLPWANASNTPFRLYKHWVHEGGISTPLIASWPAVIRKGALIHEPGHLIDIMATCLDLSGAEYPKDKTPVEGMSLAPLFREGRRKGHDAIYWEHEGNRAVRQGKWKLVARHKGPWELYDLDADRTELKNLADDHPDLVKELAAKHDAWAARAGVVPWDELNRRK